MGLLQAYGEHLRIKNNSWTNDEIKTGERCFIITISTRGKREKGGRYIGCNNNEETISGSSDISIENNICINLVDDGREVRFALLYGSNICVENNNVYGLSVPVVQLVDGNAFQFKKNVISESKNGYYAELMINKGTDLLLLNNSFSRIHSENNINCSVYILSASGVLTYKGNTTKGHSNTMAKDKTYIPCFVQDDSKLTQVEYYNKEKD